MNFTPYSILLWLALIFTVASFFPPLGRLLQVAVLLLCIALLFAR